MMTMPRTKLKDTMVPQRNSTTKGAHASRADRRETRKAVLKMLRKSNTTGHQRRLAAVWLERNHPGRTFGDLRQDSNFHFPGWTKEGN